MYWAKKQVFVCTASHCSQKGAMDVVGRLRLDIIRKGLDAEIFVNNCGTIDLCDIGPNIVVYPDNVIYHGVTIKDLPDLVEFLKGGPVVERLLLRPHAGDEQRRREFYAAAVAGEEPLPAPDFVALADAHGFDEAWVTEQQRRGFIARKPTPDGEGEAITVTKKSRVRYSV
jgi:(2Fe-2S) ferredoxin